MRILNEKSRAETEARIRELHEDLARLKDHLANLDALEKDEESQHELIDQLEHYIDAVDSKSHSLKTFWKLLWQGAETSKMGA